MIIEGFLFDFYVKCFDIEIVYKYFFFIKKENVVFWNVMFVVYGQIGNINKVYDIYLQMQMKGLEFNQYIYFIMLRICIFVGVIDMGEQIYI